jgi:hypothetical protein
VSARQVTFSVLTIGFVVVTSYVGAVLTDYLLHKRDGALFDKQTALARLFAGLKPVRWNDKLFMTNER